MAASAITFGGLIMWGQLLLAFLALFYLISIINGLIFLRNNTKKAWANIDVLLKQRNDEIPNLVEMVKGYAKHEKSLFESIAKLRSQMISSSSIREKANADSAISNSLKSLFAVAENYPKLCANENFLKLQERLSELEGQIANRREFFNDAVFLYNIRIKSVPDALFAQLLGMKEEEYFRAEEEEKKKKETVF